MDACGHYASIFGRNHAVESYLSGVEMVLFAFDDARGVSELNMPGLGSWLSMIVHDFSLLLMFVLSALQRRTGLYGHLKIQSDIT